MGQGEGAVAAAAFSERLVRVLDLVNGGQRVTKAFEALDEEGVDDPELGFEVVVDPHGGDAGCGGDPADREGLGALGLQDLGRRGEEHLAPFRRSGSCSWSGGFSPRTLAY